MYSPKCPSRMWFNFIVGPISGLFIFGCTTQSFRYTVAEPIRFEALDTDEASGPNFFGEGHGFIWTDCRRANDDAINDLLAQAESKGYDAVSGLHWYNFEKQKWIKEPTCRAEYGWVAGLYTFWWPKATKVKVQARGLKKEVIATSSHRFLFKPVTLGLKELSSSRSRELHSNDLTIGVEIMAPVVAGAGVRVGRFVETDKRWAINFEFAGLMGDRTGCSAYISNWHILSTRYEHFLGNSFYYGVGPGLSLQNFSKCLGSSVAENSPLQSDVRGSYSLVGVDFGLGNEWHYNSGLFGGCEWFGGFWGRPVKSEVDGIKEGDRKPMSFSPRILACYMGASF